MEVKEAYKFCPRCSAKFIKKSNYLKCPSCGLSFYLNPKPVQSVVLINEKAEIIFTVRDVEPRKGYLDFPGGFVENDENFEDTTRREAKEELGIEIGPLEYLSSHTDEYLFDDVNYKVTGVSYIGHISSDAKLRPADDVASVELYKLEDIPMDRLAFASMHEIIKALKTRLD